MGNFFSKVIICLLIIFLGVSFIGCAGDSSRGDTEYDQNMFYTGQPSGPRRGKSVNLDFFNKECAPNGNSNIYNGKEYECHYTGD